MPVYFIRAGTTGPIKIGWAKQAPKRIRGLQTGHYEMLSIIREIPGNRREERRLHLRFRELRVRGEWFHFDPVMLSVLPEELPDASPKAHSPKPPIILMTPAALRAWRKRLRLIRRQAAARLGLSERAMAHYEDGDRPIPRPVELACRAVEAGLD